jgi:hypothetical protein
MLQYGGHGDSGERGSYTNAHPHSHADSYAECHTHSYSRIDSHPGAHIHSWFHA